MKYQPQFWMPIVKFHWQDTELTTLCVNKACLKHYVFVEIENTKFETKWDARQTLETIYSHIYIDLL